MIPGSDAPVGAALSASGISQTPFQILTYDIQSHCNCPDFALSGHTSAPTWALKGSWGRADAAADFC
jgi:hypothetical protein